MCIGSSKDHSQLIVDHGRQFGFTLCGIASAEPSAYRERFREWIDAGQAGQMHYLANRSDERVDPAVYFPGVRSVICVAVNYKAPTDAPVEGHGRIARYAQGDDYHDALMRDLRSFADWIRETFPGCQTRCATDSAPVAERELAARAGLGWIGKNTLIIHPQIGSWLLLGEILTTLDLPPTGPMADHCGSCTRCIDACPTDALTPGRRLDARKCISYLTIEHRTDIPDDLSAKMRDWLVGCDICQEVCPFNTKAPDATADWTRPRVASNSFDPDEVAEWTTEQYHAATRKSALRRVKLPMFKRNAANVAANARQHSTTEWERQVVKSADPSDVASGNDHAQIAKVT